jgi:hypothetical protein
MRVRYSRPSPAPIASTGVSARHGAPAQRDTDDDAGRDGGGDGGGGDWTGVGGVRANANEPSRVSLNEAHHDDHNGATIANTHDDTSTYADDDHNGATIANDHDDTSTYTDDDHNGATIANDHDDTSTYADDDHNGATHGCQSWGIVDGPQRRRGHGQSFNGGQNREWHGVRPGPHGNGVTPISGCGHRWSRHIHSRGPGDVARLDLRRGYDQWHHGNNPNDRVAMRGGTHVR